MHRSEWQSLARTRLREATALVREGHWSGGYYLAGYAVECGLKSRLAREFSASTWPNRQLVRDMYTHDLAKLVRLGGLEPDRMTQAAANADFAVNWGIVKDWNEESRYSAWSEVQAQDLLAAVSDRRHGVMKWVRANW